MKKLKLLALTWLAHKAVKQLTHRELKTLLEDMKDEETYKKAFKKFTKKTKNLWDKR